MGGVEHLSSCLEDYLETVLVLKREKKVVRMRDIAKHMGVAMSSAHSAIKRLAVAGLVNHRRYESIELTEKGENMAKKILDRHNLLTQLLRDVIGVHAETAEKDACAIEHHVSQETIRRIMEILPPEKNPAEEKTLKNIEPGKSARVVRVRAQSRIRKRMLDMGISPGVVIRVKRMAPLGDPMQISILGYDLSLRKNEAASIIVEPTD